MARRETYTTKVACKACGNRGESTFSEIENTVYSRGVLNRMAEKAGDGFVLEPKAVDGIACGKCGSLDVVQV